jgi:hypothetical protein
VSHNSEAQVLQEGDVVFIHCLHLDQARKLNEQRNFRNNYLYEVEGKPRPMIILGELPERRAGLKWFRVLKLSRGNPDKRRLGYKRIGAVLGDLTESFVDCYPDRYPENMLAGPVVTQLDRVSLSSIYSIIGLKLGRPL